MMLEWRYIKIKYYYYYYYDKVVDVGPIANERDMSEWTV